MNLELDQNASDTERFRRNFQRLSQQFAPLVGVLHQNSADSTAIANTAAETNFSLSYALPKNSLAVGRTLEFEAAGTFEVGLNTNLRLKLKIGSLALLDSGDLALTAPLVGKSWQFSAIATCRAIGASGSLLTVSRLLRIDTTLIHLAAASTTVDTTAEQTLRMSATWSVANAGNTITQKHWRVSVAN